MVSKALEICQRRAKLKNQNEISLEAISRQEYIQSLRLKIYAELDPLAQSNRRVRNWIKSHSLSPADQDKYEKNVARAKDLCSQLDNLK